MSYPTFEEYDILYKKYRDSRSINELIDLAGDLNGRNVADLCCGNGEIGLKCHKKGASTVVLVDRAIDMLPLSVTLPEEVYELKCDIERLDLSDIDVAICRQGVNYWLTEKTALLMAKMINRGGVLIFNTFNRKPSNEMTVKEYKYKKNTYLEVNYMRNDMVYHVQICCTQPSSRTKNLITTPDLLPKELDELRAKVDLVSGPFLTHSTQFRWIPPKEFERMLSPYFHVERMRDEKYDDDGYNTPSRTDIYKCVRNSIEYKEDSK